MDTVIIGAGVVGSSVACQLARLGHPARVIDFDLEGALSSSELNAGGVRATLNQPVNIELSKRSIEFFAENAESVGYRACGYLWLRDAESLPGALRARESQMTLGWPVEVWDLAELRRRVPLIDKAAGIAGALFAPRDGLVNPNRVKNLFRERARASGAMFEDRLLLREAREERGKWTLECERFPAVLSQEQKTAVLTGQASAGERATFQASRVINCAGPWASQTAKILGYESPVHALRRQVCIFDCRDADLTRTGMIVDTSGVYFHPEATNGLAGFATRDEPRGFNFHSDGESFFMEYIWPALHERASAFERLKFVTGWAGLYEVSPDESAILGAVRGRPGVYELHGFSGHGVMQSYAAGLALAELIARGRFETIDASALSGERFASGKLVPETLVI